MLANKVPFAPNDTNANPAIRTFGGDANNPHLRFTDNHHGYARCALSREQYQADYRVVPSVLVEDAPVSTLASFVVEHGRAGAQQV